MLGWLILYAVLSAGGAWTARRYALRRHLVDQPGERRSHAVPTPRGGGFGIVLAMTVACLWWWPQAGEQALHVLAVLGGLLLVAGVGLADDHRPLSPWFRLLVHAVAAMVLAAGLWRIGAPWWLAALGFALAVILVNVWNFMDGINGLAASQAALVAMALAVVGEGIVAVLGLALLGAALGFLPFNFPAARVFLGDVGSGALGFVVAALIVTTLKDHPGTIPLWALPVSAFLLDAGLTLLGRLRRGERWWEPHTRHAYQAWARRAGHVRVTLAYGAWTLAAIGLMRPLGDLPAPLTVCAVAAWYMTGIAVWFLLQRRVPATSKETQGWPPSG
ncbi:lipopolysaccharide biosynthesis protein [Vulcaniibacterium gelatinicum]|uniref:lipopolysaccharide biosynthesis protein n=1 Tax=Vulcaniibacterium gelatinicum TaxID=2598725 RepID=UPI0011CCDEDB|nr:lipopolysaccharide biosynthesis protein [Vulcaniibacterium gelatinicum]